MVNIGFIGLGNMGGPMAVNLAKAGHHVIGCDLDPANLLELRDAGGASADTVAATVDKADIVITMLPAGKHVRAVYDGAEGIIANAPEKSLFIDCSTIDVSTAREIAAIAEKSGHVMLDAPVSGGIMGAQAGTLTFMCGGSDDAFNAARPVLQNMGKNIFHAGGPGNGQAAKICNNMLLGISMIGVCEAFVLAEKLGLDHQKLYDISTTASGQCWSLTTYCPVPGPVPTSPANNDYKPGFSTDMMLKDLRLAQQAATDNAAETPLGAKAAALYEALSNAGRGGDDFSAIVRYLRQT